MDDIITLLDKQKELLFLQSCQEIYDTSLLTPEDVEVLVN